jgi:polar amino acid transport system substrate-binding protein
MKTWSRVLLAVALLCVGGAVAHAQTVDDIIKRGTLRVGLDLANAPYGYLDTTMQPAGIDFEVATLAAKIMGVKLEIVQVSQASRIPTLLNGQADIMLGGFAILATRALQIWFTNPYTSSDVGLIAPAGARIASVADTAGLRVGLVRGSSQDMTFTPIAPPTCTIIRFDDDAASVAALVSGQVDATAAGAIIAQVTSEKNPGKHIEFKLKLRDNPIGIGVRRGNIDLLQWLNTYIFNIKYDGELAAIHAKYKMAYSLPIF